MPCIVTTSTHYMRPPHRTKLDLSERVGRCSVGPLGYRGIRSGTILVDAPLVCLPAGSRRSTRDASARSHGPESHPCSVSLDVRLHRNRSAHLSSSPRTPAPSGLETDASTLRSPGWCPKLNTVSDHGIDRSSGAPSLRSRALGPCGADARPGPRLVSGERRPRPRGAGPWPVWSLRPSRRRATRAPSIQVDETAYRYGRRFRRLENVVPPLNGYNATDLDASGVTLGGETGTMV